MDVAWQAFNSSPAKNRTGTKAVPIFVDMVFYPRLDSRRSPQIMTVNFRKLAVICIEQCNSFAEDEHIYFFKFGNFL